MTICFKENKVIKKRTRKQSGTDSDKLIKLSTFQTNNVGESESVLSLELIKRCFHLITAELSAPNSEQHRFIWWKVCRPSLHHPTPLFRVLFYLPITQPRFMSNKVCVELKGKQSSDFMRACVHAHWALLAIGTHSQHLKVAIRQSSTLRCRPGVIKVLHLQLSLIHPLLLFYISCVTSIFQNVAESWAKSRHLTSYKSFSWQSREGNLAPLCSRGRHVGSPWGAKRWKRWRVPFIFVSEVYVGVSVCLYARVCAALCSCVCVRDVLY